MISDLLHLAVRSPAGRAASKLDAQHETGTGTPLDRHASPMVETGPVEGEPENKSSGDPQASQLEAASPETQPSRLSRTRIVFLVIVMMTTFFLGNASGSAVILVIPDMAADLGVSELSVQWVSSSYSLANGCGLLFAGRLADIYGRKLLFLTGLSIFFVFSILSAVVRVRVALCVIRALSGLGQAIAGPAGYGIIGSTIVHEPERTIALAAIGLGNPIGASVGTILGGAVAGAGRHGWTYLFYLLAGASIIPLVIGLLVIPRDTRSLRGPGTDRRIDWLGALLVTAGTSLFLFSIVQSGIVPSGWQTPYVPALLVVSIILLVAFLFWERYLEYHTSLPPVIKFSLFTRHSYKITAIAVCAFSVCASIFGFVYVGTIFYQNYKGLDALQNAVRFLGCNVMGLFAAGSVMLLAPRVRAPILYAIGGILSGIACMLYAVEPAGTNFWKCEFIVLLCVPWGIDFVLSVGNILVSNLVEPNEQSVGGALLQTSSQIGGALGICLSALISTQRAAVTGDLLTGLRDAFWMNAAFSWIVPIAVLLGLRRVGLAKDVANALR